MSTKGKKAVVGKKRTLEETNPSDEGGKVIKKAKKQVPANNNNKAKKEVKETELEELNGSNHDQDWANNDSNSELSLSDENMNGKGDDDFQLGNLEIRVDRKTKQQIDEKLQKLQKSKKQSTQSKTEEAEEADDGRGVIYIGHLPFGFFEQQLKGFFTQFGTVTRLRVSRNPKTGRSRHYGFVEFLERDVAAIAADTMDGYMMFGKRIVSKLMEPKDVKPNLFMGANRRLGLRPAPTRLNARRQYNKPKTAEQIDKNIKKLLEAEEKKRAKLKELGIDYDFPGFAAQASKIPKKIQFGYESDSESSDEEPEAQVQPVKTPKKTQEKSPAKPQEPKAAANGQAKTPVKTTAKKSPAATPAKDAEKKTPATTPAKADKKTPATTPAKVEKSPVATPAKESVKAATPAKAEKKTPVTTPAKAEKSPAVTPAKETAKAATKTPVKTPATTPAKADKKTPVTTPAKVEKKSPAVTPAKSETKKTPVKTPGKSPKGSK